MYHIELIHFRNEFQKIATNPYLFEESFIRGSEWLTFQSFWPLFHEASTKGCEIEPSKDLQLLKNYNGLMMLLKIFFALDLFGFLAQLIDMRELFLAFQL